MRPLGVSINDLISLLREDGGADATDLELLSGAQYQAFMLKNLGDQLIGYFVGQARDSGASWTQIGQALGVSKQAAQQRWLPNIFERFNVDARQAVIAAENLVLTYRHDAVSPPHLLLAVLGNEEGSAVAAMQALEMNVPTAGDEVRRMLRPGNATPFLHGLFTPEGKEVIRQANSEAKDLGHDHVGIEHILLGTLVVDRAIKECLGSFGITYHRLRTQVRKLVPHAGELGRSRTAS